MTESRERAYIHAVSAAGVAYSITRACSRGQIAECGCDQRILSRKAKRWEWGGCSEVRYWEWDGCSEVRVMGVGRLLGEE